MKVRWVPGAWWSYAHYHPAGLVALDQPPESICDGFYPPSVRTADGAWEAFWCFKCKRVGAKSRPVVRTKRADNYFRVRHLDDWPPEVWAILKSAGIEREDVEMPSRNNPS